MSYLWINNVHSILLRFDVFLLVVTNLQSSVSVLTFIYQEQGSKGIRQWMIICFTSPMIINKNSKKEDLKLWLRSLVSAILNQPIKSQYGTKHDPSVKKRLFTNKLNTRFNNNIQLMRECVYKTLGTSKIYSSMSSPP